MVDLNKQKSLFFMELFLYLIFLDLDKIDVYRDKARKLSTTLAVNSSGILQELYTGAL